MTSSVNQANGATAFLPLISSYTPFKPHQTITGKQDQSFLRRRFR